MTLKEKLGEDGYIELLAMIQPPPSSTKAWIKGALKSWTAWFGSFLIIAPEALPTLLPQLQELLTPDAYRRAVQVIGIAVWLLRVKTTTSIAQKGVV
jgi:hypothetical protein